MKNTPKIIMESNTNNLNVLPIDKFFGNTQAVKKQEGDTQVVPQAVQPTIVQPQAQTQTQPEMIETRRGRF